MATDKEYVLHSIHNLIKAYNNAIEDVQNNKALSDEEITGQIIGYKTTSNALELLYKLYYENLKG